MRVKAVANSDNSNEYEAGWMIGNVGMTVFDEMMASAFCGSGSQ